MQAVKILVVEDEVLVGEDIVSGLRDLKYEVSGPIPTVEEAVKFLSTEFVDLALIDIGLAGDQDGIKLASYISREKNIPFIFLTSYDQSHILERAKQVSPSAYLLKPFSARSVDIAIDVALSNFSKGKISKEVDSSYDGDRVLPIQDALFIKKNNCFYRVPFTDILWLKAEGNYTDMNTSSEKYVQTIQLSKLGARLPRQKFMKVHRSYIVNIDAITGFEGNMLLIEGQRIPVSGAYKEQVFQLFRSI